MSSKSINAEEILKNIEKNRYLIPCKCKLCNKSFDDLVLGTHHVSIEHRKREKKNVIENLSWNIRDDLKKWNVLQEFKAKRDMIINTLTDDNAIQQAVIPDVVEIHRKKADISGIMEALLTDLEKSEKKEEDSEEEEVDVDEEIDERDFEDSGDDEDEEEEEEEPLSEDDEDEDDEDEEKSGTTQPAKKRNLCELLERELEKYAKAIKRVIMSAEVEKALSSKTKSQASLDKYAEQLDYFLGVAKAVQIIKESGADLEIIL